MRLIAFLLKPIDGIQARADDDRHRQGPMPVPVDEHA